MSLITVVIPNYKGIEYLNPCLEALYAQRVGTPEFEILVVDNASADGSIERAKELYKAKVQKQAESVDAAAHVPSTRFLCLEQNTGFCHAVNVGIENSDSPYVILLNNDTKVSEEFVGNLYKAIRRDKTIFSVSAQMLMWDYPALLDDAGDRYNVLGWAYAVGKGQAAALYDRPKHIFSACGGAAIYRRSILERIGLFDELHFAYLEDLDIGYRARIYGYKNVYEPSAKVLHFGSASSGSRYNEFKTKLASANNIYVIYKNMPAAQILMNLPFLAFGFLIKWLFFVKKGMGGTYLKGLAEGLSRCVSPEGKEKKVKFQKENLHNYVQIQLELYLNAIYFLTKK